MKAEPNKGEKVVKPILPQKPILPVPKSRDRLALALQRGWVKPAHGRHLTVYVIESRSGLPWHIRIRDWFLMSLAWIGWGLLLFDAASNSPTEATRSFGPAYWYPNMSQELLFGLLIANSLILVLALFGTYTLYRFRNPLKEIPEPTPLRNEELTECCGIDIAILKEWHMARSLKISINDLGKMVDYEIFPQDPPEDVII